MRKVKKGRVWNLVTKKWIEVVNLKTVKSEAQPQYVFFIHKNLDGKKYTMSESSSGAAVIHCKYKKDVIGDGLKRLKIVSQKEFKGIVDCAIKKTKIND